MEEKNPFETDGSRVVPESASEIESILKKMSDVPTPKSSLDEAFEIIKADLDTGKKFSNAQLDLCAEIVMTMLPQSEREWLREIATSNGYPAWVVMLAQWRRCNEYGECAALLVDPDWQIKIDER